MRNFRELLKYAVKDEYGYYITAYANIQIIDYGRTEYAKVHLNFVNATHYIKADEFLAYMIMLSDETYRVSLIQQYKQIEDTNRIFENGYGIE
jgi:hypothetical protein